jgi:hypothetical protein
MIIAVVCDAVSVVEHDSTLLENLEKKENAQERILKLQQRVDYLKKQQLNTMAKVTDALTEIQKQDKDFSLPLEIPFNTNTTGCTTSTPTGTQGDTTKTDVL